MSYTELYYIDRNGDCQSYHKYGGSPGFCLAIWDAMAKKYFGCQSYKDIGDNKKLWALANDSRVAFCEKATLMATFDNVMVAKENIAELSKCFIEFIHLHPALYGDSHLIEMAVHMSVLAELDTCFGICWQATSIIAYVWKVYLPDNDDYRPYNIHQDKKHWWMFQHNSERVVDGR